MVFGFFKSPRFRDPELGEFARSRGRWRGSLALGSGASVPLVVSGSRSQPDPRAVEAAREVPARLAAWRPAIEAALFAHYEPYAEALAAGELAESDATFARIAAPGGVWPHVSLEFVAVTPLDGVLTIELGYTTAWDEEHTLGARFQAGRLIELCGSVLPP